MSHVIQCPDVVRLAACLVMVSALVLSDLVLALNGASLKGRYFFYFETYTVLQQSVFDWMDS